VLASGRRDALRALLRREPTCSIDVMYSAEFLDQPLVVPPRAEAQLLAHDDRVRPRPVHPPRFGRLLRIAISAFPSGVGSSRRIAMRRTSICLPIEVNDREPWLSDLRAYRARALGPREPAGRNDSCAHASAPGQLKVGQGSAVSQAESAPTRPKVDGQIAA